jgi:hypothetical protein
MDEIKNKDVDICRGCGTEVIITDRKIWEEMDRFFCDTCQNGNPYIQSMRNILKLQGWMK